MPQEFTITLTDEEAAQLRELADYWHPSPDEALRRVAVQWIDMELQVKAHDERDKAGLPSTHPTGDLDDGIPF